MTDTMYEINQMHHYQTLSYNTDYWLCFYCEGPIDIVKRTLLR